MIVKKECKKRKQLTKKQKCIRIGYVVLILGLISAGLWLFLSGKDKYDEEKKQEMQFVKIQEEKDKKGTDYLKRKYKDMVGWIEIPKTDFSYPVMQSGIKKHHEEDPEFYLHRDVHGEYSFVGTPFLDSRCGMESDNLIIYGHNINGGRMFGYLHGYRQQGFYKKHPMVYFTKVGEKKTAYDVVSVIVADIRSFMYSFTDVYTDTVYKEDIEKLLSQSIYETEAGKELKNEIKDADVEEFFHKEKFITLSTCRTMDGRDKRLLIVAKKRG